MGFRVMRQANAWTSADPALGPGWLVIRQMVRHNFGGCLFGTRFTLIDMVVVRFPPHLIRHFPVPTECAAEGNTVAEAVLDLERQYPGLTGYLIHENGTLRQHVNIFLGEQMVRDRAGLSDSLEGVNEMFVMQALSGG